MIPLSVRQAVDQRAAGRCESCGERQRLELHHTSYDLYDVTGYHRDVGASIVGFETPDMLRALCRACHYAAHLDEYGVFHANPVEIDIP
jgi:hypothetical protein